MQDRISIKRALECYHELLKYNKQHGRELRDSVSFIGIVVALNFIHMPEMYSF